MVIYHIHQLPSVVQKEVKKGKQDSILFSFYICFCNSQSYPALNNNVFFYNILYY